MLLLLLLGIVSGQLFQSIQYEQPNEVVLPITGTIPLEINGIVYRNGFGKFEGYEFEFTHLFDALSLVMSFRIQKGKVWSRFKLLDSDYKNQSTFHIPPYRTLGEIIPPPNNWMVHGLHDNRNGNIIPYGKHLLAINDMAGGVLLDTNLQTIGKLNPFLSIMSSTHPIQKDNYLYNYEINALGYYEVYRVSDTVKETILKIPATQFSYLHSFSITEQYIILALYPVTWNITSIFLSHSILPELSWTQNKTFIYIIHKDTGEFHVIPTDPIFSFHHINAYEAQPHSIILDMIVYHNLSCFYDLTLESLRRTSRFTHGTLRRYDINILSNLTKWYEPSFPSFEMPSLHPHFVSRPYQYWYGMGVQNNNGYPLLQGDMIYSTIKKWEEPYQYPSEPLFITTGPNELDGIIVSLVYDGFYNYSYLLFLDTNMNQLATANLSIPIPFTCHGHFFTF